MEWTISRNCPKCGKEMLEGWVPSGGGKMWLLWYPKDKQPRKRDIFKHGFPFFKRGDPENGMMLFPFTEPCYYLPALNCPDCKLVILDYDETHAD